MKGKSAPKCPPRLTRTVALAMIGLAVVGGFVLVNPAAGVGLGVLAGLRLWIFRREEERARTQAPSDSGT